MSSRHLISRLIIFGFLVLVGFALAMGIYYKSFLGITLALLSLGAAVYFLYIVAQARREMQEAAEEMA
jgi:Na+/H+ antiporter NhaD/arsenite permease-like protein